MASNSCQYCSQPIFKNGLCFDHHRQGFGKEGKEQSHNFLNTFGKQKLDVERECNRINEEFLSGSNYPNFNEDLASEYKEKFIEMDENGSGDIDIHELGRAMERLGKPKNQIQLKKMIEEVDMNGSGTIFYNEFLTMMLGKKSSVLRLILMFESKGKEEKKPAGPPPKKNFADLP